MKIKETGNQRIYSSCMHYFKSSNKHLKSMRIANNILKTLYPNFKFSHCEAMFPTHDSQFKIVEKLGVKIVFEISKIHENKLYFSFIEN